MDMNYLTNNNSSSKKQKTIDRREMLTSEVNEAYNNETAGYGLVRKSMPAAKILSRASTSFKPMSQTFSKQINSTRLRNN